MDRCVACGNIITYPNIGANKHKCPKRVEVARANAKRSNGHTYRKLSFNERLTVGFNLMKQYE